MTWYNSVHTDWDKVLDPIQHKVGYMLFPTNLCLQICGDEVQHTDLYDCQKVLIVLLAILLKPILFNTI